MAKPLNTDTPITALKLKSDFPDLVTSIHGSMDREFFKVTTIHEADTSSLVFANSESFMREALDCKAQVIVSKSFNSIDFTKTKKTIIVTDLPDLLISLILQKYFYEDFPLKKIKGQSVASSADVKLAKLPRNIFIGNNSVVGDCQLGENIYIGNNVIIENGVSIGDNSIIMDQSIIYKNVSMGEACFIRSGTSIGNDCFHSKVQGRESLGTVVLGNKVETGSMVAIDKPISGTTFVGTGTKIDNLVKVADLVSIGENSLITAGVQIGHGAKIGKYFMVGGNSFINPNVKIADKVICGGMTYVDEDIVSPGAYGGNPVQPMKDYLKTLTSLARIPQLRKLMKSQA